MNATELVELLEKSRMRTITEETFQVATAQALTDAGVEFKREHPLSRGDRVDFMVGDIALELKIDGSSTEVLRQLQRYAQHEEVQAIVLLTSRSKLCRMPNSLNNKPLYVALIQRGIR
jgi:DNA-binding LytR/AlgR family response regulator